MESKRDKNFWRFFWNICDFWEKESTRDDARGAHEGEGCARGGRARPGPSWPLRKAVGALLSPQEIQYPDKNCVQISAHSELRISGNLRNGEMAESGSAETEGNRERDPISEGLPPLRRHGGQGPEGKPFSHLGGRSRKKNKGGSPSLPVAPERCRGHHRDNDLHQQLHRRHHQLFPPLCRGVTPLLPVVIST